MKYRDVPQATKDAAERIGAAIEAEHDLIGPGSEFSRMGLIEAEDFDEEPPKDALLSEWVLCTCYIDPATGDTWRLVITSPNLPSHHREGLLQSFTW